MGLALSNVGSRAVAEVTAIGSAEATCAVWDGLRVGKGHSLGNSFW